MNEIEKVELCFKKDDPLVQVKEYDKSGKCVIRCVPPSSLERLFTGTLATGFLPVSHNGIVSVTRNKDYTVAVAQRAGRKMPITFIDKKIEATTPYAVGIFGLKPLGDQYKIVYHKIFALKGPLLGFDDSVYTMPRVGNFYPDNSGSNTNYNICWGNPAPPSISGSKVSLGSLCNVLDDFFLMPFNNHLQGTVEVWKAAANSSDPLMNPKPEYSLQEGINHALSWAQRNGG